MRESYGGDQSRASPGGAQNSVGSNDAGGAQNIAGSSGSGSSLVAAAGTVAPSPMQTCSSVRLTPYPAGDVAWCEYNRNAPVLPEFVRNGLTLAIAEPWSGSSYGGASGEACGECWEITSLDATRIAMVHDLCPVEGNPLCSGSHFDFDLSLETSKALNLQGLDEGTTRRVPCPVIGNAFLQLIDRDEWGNLRFQVINHRIPVRSIEFHEVGSHVYFSAERSAAAWAVSKNRSMFASNAAGGSFRLTSAQGEVVEMPSVLTHDVSKGSYFDLGGQFSDQLPPPSGQCQYLPPKEVYVNGYGGIENVQWMMNPWAGVTAIEVSERCASGSCLRISGLRPGSGFHIYYRQTFDPSTFRTLHFTARTDSGTGTINALLTSNDTACQITPVTLGETWTEWRLNLASVCAGVPHINAVSFHGVTPLTVLFDDIRFEP